MDVAAIRDSSKLNIAALSLKLLALNVKTAFIVRGLNEKSLHMELEYAILYESLERAAENADDHGSALSYGSQKREHQNEAKRISRELYSPQDYAIRG